MGALWSCTELYRSLESIGALWDPAKAYAAVPRPLTPSQALSCSVEPAARCVAGLSQVCHSRCFWMFFEKNVFFGLNQILDQLILLKYVFQKINL